MTGGARSADIPRTATARHRQSTRGTPLLWIAGVAAALLSWSSSGAGDLDPGKVQRAFPSPTQTAIPKAEEDPREQTFPAASIGAVDWSYLRRNAPELVGAMVDQVRTGEAPARALAGIAKSATIAKLAKRGAGVKPIPPPGDSSAVAAKLRSVSLTSLLPLEVSPSSVKFGSLVDGQKVEKLIYVRNAPRGVAKATLEAAAGSPFRIVSMKVLDGRLTKRAVTEAKLNPASQTADRTLLAAYEWKGVAAASDPRIAAGAAKVRDAGKRLEATAAPFEIDADEGATVRLVVAFSPKYAFGGGTSVGRHRGAIGLDFDGRTARVDLEAYFEGVDIGILVVPQVTETTVLASPKYGSPETHNAAGPGPLRQALFMTIDVALANPKGESQRVPFWIVSGPAGATLDEVDNSADERFRNGSQTMTVPAGKSTGRLWFSLPFLDGLDGRSHVAYGLGQEILVGYRAGNVERTMSLTLNVLPDHRLFSMQNPAKPGFPTKVGDVACLFNVLLAGSGAIDFYYYLAIASGSSDVAMTFFVGNVPIVQLEKELSRYQGLKREGNVKLGSEWVRDHWLTALEAPGTFRVTVD